VSSRTLLKGQQILILFLTATLSTTGLIYQVKPNSEPPRRAGRIIAMASAVEYQTLEKEVGQSIQFKVKVKNTGNVETTYLIFAKRREDGTEEWESDGFADVRLSPGHYEALVVGSVECMEEMAGKYFDVKFLLYDYETETLLDEKEIDRAWHVKETIVTGTIISYWIE